MDRRQDFFSMWQFTLCGRSLLNIPKSRFIMLNSNFIIFLLALFYHKCILVNQNGFYFGQIFGFSTVKAHNLNGRKMKGMIVPCELKSVSFGRARIFPHFCHFLFVTRLFYIRVSLRLRQKQQDELPDFRICAHRSYMRSWQCKVPK